MLKLRRYWIRFKRLDRPDPLNLDCGATAWTCDDALNLIAERVFSGGQLPEVVDVIEDVDVRTLDEGHVRPNMGDVTERGIWYPLGFNK
jgi:hypothetical protein